MNTWYITFVFLTAESRHTVINRLLAARCLVGLIPETPLIQGESTVSPIVSLQVQKELDDYEEMSEFLTKMVKDLPFFAIILQLYDDYGPLMVIPSNVQRNTPTEGSIPELRTFAALGDA